jgi:spore coat polysaccharide biosynthesis predicted glycosyltransferase SpsG
MKSLIPFWGQCDVAITAAGNTLFERIATRLPGATLCQLERQVEIADRFESLGVNLNLGFGPVISDDILRKRITDFIDNRKLQRLQYQKSPEIVDGRGLERFGNEIKRLLEGHCNELRKTGKGI